MTIKKLFKTAAILLALAGCAEEGASIVETQGNDVLQADVQPLETRGTFDHEGQQLSFSTVVREGVVEVSVELRGLVLFMTLDTENGIVDTDGYAAENGEDTQLLADDVAMLRRFEKRLATTYSEHAETPSLDYLSRAITLWSGVTPSFPLKHTYHGRFDRSASLCGDVNKPGQGVNTKKYIAATHDCMACHWLFGCNNWDDRSTVDKVFMSMHPDGSCGDDTYFGTNTGNYSCYEPNHDANVEYAYGGCFGRCGAGCGNTTQFTRACLDHDLCVRFGHSIADVFCADEFSGTGVDVAFAPNCGGHITIDYNWAGSGNENSCPTSWNGTNDGCDHGCQFIDGDCFR